MKVLSMTKLNAVTYVQMSFSKYAQIINTYNVCNLSRVIKGENLIATVGKKQGCVYLNLEVF